MLGILWFAVLAAAGLSYPRLPRVAGGLWIALGGLSLVQAAERGAWFGAVSGIFFVGLGISYLVKFRHPDVRARHVEYWTAKA